MSDRLLRESDVIEAVTQYISSDYSTEEMARENAELLIGQIPSADRPKHYCSECKYEPIDKRCMPCSSCTNNPKNRDAFVSREVER